MTEILGQRCVHCAEVIEDRDAADFCDTCGRAVHHLCQRVPDRTTSHEHCADCGAALPPAPSSTFDTTQFEVDVQPGEDRAVVFYSTLLELTPRVYVTPTLIGINVLIFIAMVATGVSFTSPTVADLLLWGANFGPMTMGGEWWRLFTAMFLHIGIIHILFNMWVLAAAGPLVERMLGNVGFLLLYLVAGLGGSMASLLWNPMLVSAGASGAIFGIYGALLALLLRQQGSIPGETLASLRNSGLTFVAYNLFFGFTMPNIDNAAHIGGLVSGFLSGLVLCQPFRPEASAGRIFRNIALGVLGTGLILGGAFGVTARHAHVKGVSEELQRFETIESQALEKVNQAASQAEKGDLSNESFANLLEQEVIPPWRDSRERLSQFEQIPPSLEEHVKRILEYMRLREEAWELFAQAMREENEDTLQLALQKQEQADAAARRVADGAGE